MERLTPLPDLTIMLAVYDGRPENLMHLDRALGGILGAVRDTTVALALDHEPIGPIIERFRVWEPLFAQQGIHLHTHDPRASRVKTPTLAHKISHTIIGATTTWTMNHDIDLLVRPEAWHWIGRALAVSTPKPDRNCLYYNFVDVADRGFPGWTRLPQPYLLAGKIQAEFGDHGLVYRQWAVPEYQDVQLRAVTDVWAGSYIVRNAAVSSFVHGVLATFTPGQRGHDRILTQGFRPPKGCAHVILGATAHHFGTDPIMGRNFDSFHPLVAAERERFVSDEIVRAAR